MIRRLPAVLALTAGFALAGYEPADEVATPASVSVPHPITLRQRADWVFMSTLGPTSLFTSAVTAGISTARDNPYELGPHWKGFGERVGIRLTDRAVATGIEAGVGALWGEDPRYVRGPERPFSGRVSNVLRQTVFSHDRNGKEMPAYARFIAIPSAGFIANTYKPDSQSSTGDALGRIGSSFANHILANAYVEFWPDLKGRVFHHSAPAAYDDSVQRYISSSQYPR